MLKVRGGIAIALAVALNALSAIGVGAFTAYQSPITGAADVAVSFPTCGGQSLTGPIGIVNDGTNLFADDVCNGVTYRFSASGTNQPAASAQQVANGLKLGMVIGAGTFYGVDGTGALHTMDPLTMAVGPGHLPDGAATGCHLLGLAGDPRSTDLYASTFNFALHTTCGILRIQNPASDTPTFTVFNSGIVGGVQRYYDGVQFTSDGSKLWAADETTKAFAAFDRSGTVVQSTVTSHSVDGIAVITQSNPSGFGGDPVANSNDGAVTLLETSGPNAGTTIDVATAGTRGDFATVGPDGCMYVTQSDRIQKLLPCIFEALHVPTETGSAYALRLVDPITGTTVIDPVGPVSTDRPSYVERSVLSVTKKNVQASVLLASVRTVVGRSDATARVASAVVSTLVATADVQAFSTTNCTGSYGKTTIGSLTVAGKKLVNITPAPNTPIDVPGVVHVVLNEQVPVPGGLRVNAIHVTASALGLDVVISSATSDIHDCVAPA